MVPSHRVWYSTIQRLFFIKWPCYILTMTYNVWYDSSQVGYVAHLNQDTGPLQAAPPVGQGDTNTRRVPYFGGRSLDTDPDFSRYWHFCSPFIDAHTDKNPYKRGTNTFLGIILGYWDILYLKVYHSWRDIGTAKCLNLFW